MKKYLLLSLLVLLFHLSSAQTDPVYFSKHRKEVSNRQDATYYRVITPQDSVFKATEYYLDGTVKMEGILSSVKPEIYNGIITWYSEAGQLTGKGFFKNNKRENHLIGYYPDGAIKSDALYKANTLNGEHTFYYPNRQLKRIDIYKEGKFISGRCFTSTGADAPYYPYLQNPEFVGGATKLGEYMTAKLVYPSKAIRAEITGTVKVKFTVTAVGEITEVHLENAVHPLLDQEALKLVKNMPRWKPGLEDNEKANFSFILPVEFRLQD